MANAETQMDSARSENKKAKLGLGTAGVSADRRGSG
jgi:hypothetical protein